MTIAQITPVILTWNEAANIDRVLSRLQPFARVVIVDSGSEDETRALAEAHDNVAWFERPFDQHARQWQYAVDETGIDTDWVLVMDADYVLTDAFVDGLSSMRLTDGCAWLASFEYCIDGQALRASLYPDRIVLIQRERCRFIQDGHTQRIDWQGATQLLAGRIQHDDRKSEARWLLNQTRYAALEAERILSTPFWQRRLSNRLRSIPGLMPILVPLVLLFGKGLILDGRAGRAYVAQRRQAERLIQKALGQARRERS